MSGGGQPPPWRRRVGRRLARWASKTAPRRWVVAVSGGPDSVAMLRLLHEAAPALGLELVVAHLDHGARGEASRGDAAFVAALAGGLGLPLVLGDWSPPRAAHFEADARAARYGWLLGVAAERGAAAIVVGHTRDDQAETVLQRLLRGTGLRGLAGMPARRRLGPGVVLLRPLLDVPRDALRAFLAENGQPWRDDASNADLRRTRARLRHDLLPKLAAEYNPRVAEALARLAATAGAASRALDRADRGAAARLVLPEIPGVPEGALVLSRAGLRRHPPGRRADLLRQLWRRAGWPEGEMDAGRWRRLARLADGSPPPRLDVGAGIVARVLGPALILGPAAPPIPPPTPPDPRPLAIPGAVDWPGGRLVLTLDPRAARDESIDLDRLRPPLLVRTPRPGDRFAPLGMGGRSTPLRDFLRRRRVPPAARPQVPLLCDGDGILWVVGHRIADRVRLTAETTRTAGLRWEPIP